MLFDTLGGNCGDRPLADFSQQHWSSWCALLALPADRQLPAYSTVRRVLPRVDFEHILELFNRWSQLFIQLVEPARVAVDGKSIKSTLRACSKSSQNLVTTISAFTHQTGVVLNLQILDNKQTRDLEVVRPLIAALAEQPLVFTLEALHTQAPHRGQAGWARGAVVYGLSHLC